MLTQLTISNFAIVDRLVIELKPGMTVITGETGAGKSIIFGALGLALGDRADKGVIRSGASKADISAEFDIRDNPEATVWLNENDLGLEDQPETCILRRVVAEDGRSKAYINGFPVTLVNLKTLGEMLIDIHSQHEHQSLLKRETHARLLDEFAGNQSPVAGLRRLVREWQDNNHLIKELSSESEAMIARRELTGYQVTELDELALADGEIEALEQEFRQLNNADDTVTTVQSALNLCCEDEEHNLSHGLGHAIGLMQQLAHPNKTQQAALELLQNAAIQLDEAGVELRRALDQLEINPERLDTINDRLGAIHQMARKHKTEPAQLLQLHQELKAQLDRLQNSDVELEKCRQQDSRLRQQYHELANTLSRSRKKASTHLAKLINGQLKDLGMPDASLVVELTASQKESPSATGAETVEFLVSTNPGQPPKPLIKIASGGELSRISLAIQVITAKTSRTPTLVFDEVDVGIGGNVARSVGKLLRQLGGSAQILCVTHQAQVASQGHNHYYVSKTVSKTASKTASKTVSKTASKTASKTVLKAGSAVDSASAGKAGSARSAETAITELNHEDKIREVARMLGGESDESLAHAEKMVS
ncbi:MAG: DNA repair protein RecN [Pseudohongiellaceae bacterium]